MRHQLFVVFVHGLSLERLRAGGVQLSHTRVVTQGILHLSTLQESGHPSTIIYNYISNAMPTHRKKWCTYSDIRKGTKNTPSLFSAPSCTRN